jgi:hypothetical protein
MSEFRRSDVKRLMRNEAEVKMTVEDLEIENEVLREADPEEIQYLERKIYGLQDALVNAELYADREYWNDEEGEFDDGEDDGEEYDSEEDHEEIDEEERTCGMYSGMYDGVDGDGMSGPFWQNCNRSSFCDLGAYCNQNCPPENGPPSPFSFAALRLELSNDTLAHQRLIRPRPSTLRRRLTQHIARIERSRSPSNPSEIYVRILIQRSKLLAQISKTASRITPTPGLRQDRLSPLLPQPISKRREHVFVVSNAIGVCAAVIGIQVPVYVKDEALRAAVRVLHLSEGSARAVFDEVGRGRVVRAW